jgi:redox-regulated HSP33 family molecular chaperone
MMPDLTPYSAILNEKWISRIDFIYRIKSHCDCSEERHRKFLQLLYRMNFSYVRKGQKGEILIQ